MLLRMRATGYAQKLSNRQGLHRLTPEREALTPKQILVLSEAKGFSDRAIGANDEISKRF